MRGGWPMGKVGGRGLKSYGVPIAVKVATFVSVYGVPIGV